MSFPASTCTLLDVTILVTSPLSVAVAHLIGVTPPPPTFNSTRIALFIGGAILAIVLLVVGLTLSIRAERRRKRGEGIEGLGISISLLGIMIGVLVADVSYTFFVGSWSAISPLRYWWFLEDAPQGDGIATFLSMPFAWLMIAAIFIFAMGLPSWTQIRTYVRDITHPRTRVDTLWVSVLVILSLAGGFVGAWFFGSMARMLAVPGAFIGGFAVMFALIGIEVLWRRYRRKNTKSGGEK